MKYELNWWKVSSISDVCLCVCVSFTGWMDGWIEDIKRANWAGIQCDSTWYGNEIEAFHIWFDCNACIVRNHNNNRWRRYFWIRWLMSMTIEWVFGNNNNGMKPYAKMAHSTCDATMWNAVRTECAFYRIDSIHDVCQLACLRVIWVPEAPLLLLKWHEMHKA